MIALAWLFLAWLAGWRIAGWLVFGKNNDGAAGLGFHAGAGCRQSSLAAWLDYRPAAGLNRQSPWPALLFRLAVSLWLGLLPLTWLTYGVAALLARVLPLNIHPLLIANTLILLSLGVWQAWSSLQRLFRSLQEKAAAAGLPGTAISGAALSGTGTRTFWTTLIRSFQDSSSRFFLLTLLVWLLLGGLMMTGTFYRDGSLYKAGYSVFSDFAPHTALVSSFSQGLNWPTEYPHFANDGIAYHFMFFFLCGNLNYLGLPLDWSINLPSVLGLLTFCILLGQLAMRLTGRTATFLLAPLLLFCRSSWAFFTFLGDLAAQYGTGLAAWPSIFGAMLRQEVYIGNTTNDSWGLWGVNVYANQRHLLPGLSIALIVLFLFLPDLQDGLQRRPGWRQLLFSREYWQVRGPDGWRRLAAALLLCLLLPYFHGSVLVALLLILGLISIFSSNRLAFLAVGCGSVASALIQSRIFAGQATRVIRPALLIGFIAPDKTLPGILAYLLEMSGILLPLLMLVFWLPGRRRKILLASFMLPLVFALTISLTPDVTVNHKFIMISFAFGNIYIADLLARLWERGRSARPARPVQPALLARRLAALLLAALLMLTGLQEMIILHNINKKTVAIDASSPLVNWIRLNTRPDAVFVSAPYHYNAFYLSGRFTWLGHSYYAWSAGHDTAGRLKQEQWLLTGCGGDLAAVQELIDTSGLDYLLLDDTLRDHEEFAVNEAFFDAHYVVAVEFRQLGKLKVYDLRQAKQ